MIRWLPTAAVLWASCAPAAAGEFHFTVTADPRDNAAAFDAVLASIQAQVGGGGAFHVSPGDIDPPAPLRDTIDARFGGSFAWYPGMGNHEAETAEDMDWLRAEYTSGQGGRAGLKTLTHQNGPAGSAETTYSWDYGNAHFVMLNEYWDGGTGAGSDAATDGDIVGALRDWLAADLATSHSRFTFVFGHEPAYPQGRHVGDSLDEHAPNRDAFWSLLESCGVQAFICGHTHFYSRLEVLGVWQIDVGNAGNDTSGDGKTFLDVTVGDFQARFDVYRDGGSGDFMLADSWTVVPEPPSAAALLLGAAAVLRPRRGRFRARQARQPRG